MPAANPIQNGDSASPYSRNLPQVVRPMMAPPPAALPSMAMYSARLRVM